MDSQAQGQLLSEVIKAKAKWGDGQPYAQYEPNGEGPISPTEALTAIDKIRNSIVGLQTINWSEHIYPLVAILNRAGIQGLGYPENKENFGTLLDNYEAAIELLKTSPSMQGRSEWRIQVETFLKRSGKDS